MYERAQHVEHQVRTWWSGDIEDIFFVDSEDVCHRYKGKRGVILFSPRIPAESSELNTVSIYKNYSWEIHIKNIYNCTVDEVGTCPEYFRHQVTPDYANVFLRANLDKLKRHDEK